jgi:hypothetical protein
MSVESIHPEISRITRFGRLLEDLVYNEAKAGKIVFHSKNDDLLVTYWSIIFSYCKGITCLLHLKYHAPAFALLRPLVEALVRVHIVLIGDEQDVSKIRKDRYKVSYEKDGARIDKAFGTGSMFDDFLKTSRDVLHSFTHSGTAQLNKSWDADWLGSGFSETEIGGLLAACSVAVYLVTILMTKHYGLEEQSKAATAAWMELENSEEAKRQEAKMPGKD